MPATTDRLWVTSPPSVPTITPRVSVLTPRVSESAGDQGTEFGELEKARYHELRWAWLVVMGEVVVVLVVMVVVVKVVVW